MAFAFSMGYGKAAVDRGRVGGSPAAVNEMATKYIGSWYAAILDVVVILDAMALALAICVTIGRGYFALSRDGLLPKVFAKTSRFNTPWVGEPDGRGRRHRAHARAPWLADYQGRFVVPGENGDLVPIFPSDRFATFILSATIGSFAVELVYLDPGRRRVRPRTPGGQQARGSTPSSLVAVATPILGYFGALKPGPHDRSNVNWEAIYWTIGVVVAGASVVRRRAPPAPRERPHGGRARGRAPRRRRRSTRRLDYRAARAEGR